ncbi:MAG: hypothetical protein FWE08_04760 [Oscillospiraceae bacterium]|nr:hypothetical protein [Oscillospiraceae bacterium]
MRKGIIVLIIVVLAVLLASIFLWLWSVSFSGTFCAPAERREVTDFVGRHIDIVLDNEQLSDFYDFLIEYEETDSHPAGIIFRQGPAAGREVGTDSDGLIRVTLFVAVPT